MKQELLKAEEVIGNLKLERQDLQEHLKAQRKMGKGGKGSSVVYTIATDKK